MWTPGSGGGGGGEGGSGDVTGPASSTDNALARYDGTGGKTLQDGGLRVTDSGLLQFEGTSANFPGLKRAGAVLQAKTANDGTTTSFSARRPFTAPGTGTLPESQTRYLITNSGASGAQTFTLPSATLPTPGAIEYLVVVTDAHDIVLQAAGSDVIYSGTSPSSAGGTLTLSGVGTVCLVTIAKAGIWVTLVNGTATPA